jgi:hypothetical protein
MSAKLLSQVSSRRLFGGFLAAPIIPAIIVSIPAAIGEIVQSGLNDTAGPLTLIILVVFCGYLPEAILGVPILLIGRRWLTASWLTCVTFGALVAALPWTPLFLYFAPRDAGWSPVWPEMLALIAGLGGIGGVVFRVVVNLELDQPTSG